MREIQTYKNVPEVIAETLKEGILHGKFKGGAQLKQDEIAKQFNVSLIPVREALIQLEAKGLVKCIRNKGTIVTNLSVEEMQELFEVRKILETGIIKSLPDVLEVEKLDKMKFLLTKMEKENDIFMLERHNRLFHELLCDMANNSQINQIYQNLFVRVERYLMYMYYFTTDKTCGLEDHHMIVELLEKRDSEALLLHSKNHIDVAHQAFLNYLEENYKRRHFDWNDLIPFE
ncbi:MAG: GntR family transcriptional regulator [Cellulosilyticaceae bacterium]